MCVCVCVCVVSVMDDSSARVHVVSRSPLVVSEWKTTKRIRENYIVIGNTLLISANICCNIFHNIIIFFCIFDPINAGLMSKRLFHNAAQLVT